MIFSSITWATKGRNSFRMLQSQTSYWFTGEHVNIVTIAQQAVKLCQEGIMLHIGRWCVLGERTLDRFIGFDLPYTFTQTLLDILFCSAIQPQHTHSLQTVLCGTWQTPPEAPFEKGYLVCPLSYFRSASLSGLARLWKYSSRILPPPVSLPSHFWEDTTCARYPKCGQESSCLFNNRHFNNLLVIRPNRADTCGTVESCGLTFNLLFKFDLHTQS